MKFTLVVYDGGNGPCHRGVIEPEVRKLAGSCSAVHNGTLYLENNGVLIDAVEGMCLLVPHGELDDLPETGTEFTEEDAVEEGPAPCPRCGGEMPEMASCKECWGTGVEGGA
jgi:hypothetical protein